MPSPLAFLDRSQPAFTPTEAAHLASTHFGLHGVLTPLVSERDQNFRIEPPEGDPRILKIASARQDPGVVDLQIRALAHLAGRDPALPLHRTIPTRTGAPTAFHTTPAGDEHILWMVGWLPGSVMAEHAPHSPRLRRDLGTLLARLDLALHGFFHPHARHNHPWDLTRTPALLPHTHHIADASTRGQVETIFRTMETDVLPRLGRLRHQVIHQDGHSHNVLVDPARQNGIAGLLDFGDMIFGPLVCELAVAASSCLADDRSDDPLAALCDVAAGYDRVLPLEPDEIDLLYDLVLARHAQTIAITALRLALYPDDAPHADLEEGVVESLAANIDFLLETGRAQVSDRLRSTLGFPPYIPAPPGDDDALLARRDARLGRAAPHFYARPLHLERGEGVWLYGADGQRYLDCYNNIPQVGHGHPRVVRAIARQAAALNTHTRYLYRPLLDYADRLTEALPAHLSACVFVNSGSEANDVAYRMAQAYTGRRSAVIMADAYHGITESIAALSPEGSDRPLAPHVAALLTPDPYAGPFRVGDDLPECYAADADRALAELEGKGFGAAAWMVDPALTSSGIPAPPDGYFAAVARRIRAAGGLVIADEVQSGFGRMGSMWGHVLRGFEADIVTLGKPVGNGYPLGVVVTRPEILGAFTAKTGLFSTFGGSPVACAAGLAVLDVIEEEGLVENARSVGAYFRERLSALMPAHLLIGDVRGEGLMIGVALVADREKRTPAPEIMPRLLEALRARGVLAGSAGRHGDILKIRPPIVLRREHVDLCLDTLDGALAEIDRNPKGL
ncbi:MAG TPA: aminotransferase class III-fold pyridoxal phosphate-dependent enzyme [Anaerolineales bacterium]|nr:aminotransferase class III-fold pyridoxal phosphate-dependent enzyme [Anaerolineales bacterium]